MRIALGISYLGTHYQGWQSQPSGQTVQDKLERALSDFATVPGAKLCAGRPDAGVPGLMQAACHGTSHHADAQNGDTKRRIGHAWFGCVRCLNCVLNDGPIWNEQPVT